MSEILTLEQFREGVPGIYPSIPFPEYALHDAVNNSKLKEAAKSGAHLKVALNEEKPDTESLMIGRAVHTALLEPDLYARDYAIAPKCDRRTSDGKAIYNNFLADNFGKTVIDQATGVLCEQVRDSVMHHPIARKLMEAEGWCEQTFLAKDPLTDVLCKARTDKYMIYEDRFTIVDLKTTVDASPDGFPRQVAKYGYDMQGGFYTDIAANLQGVPHTEFIIIAVEKKAPFAVTVWRMSHEALAGGKTKYRAALKTYINCTTTGLYPGWAEDEMLDLSLPRWAEVEVTEEEELVNG
ncbi:MAG: PD-(D/E)XK nuclease-like domain-containing protein [Bacteroidetes bacterium]|nr:PD-(D/E)XK nuclease-like domain-containing protein [Bacteroidota bacterium]